MGRKENEPLPSEGGASRSLGSGSDFLWGEGTQLGQCWEKRDSFSTSPPASYRDETTPWRSAEMVTRELELGLREVERLPGHSQAVGGLLIGWEKEHPGSLSPILPGSWWPSLQGPSSALLLPRILFENSETHFSSSALV